MTLPSHSVEVLFITTFRRMRYRLWDPSDLRASAGRLSYCGGIRMTRLTTHLRLIFGTEFVGVRYHAMYIP
jgi:hypothetical protein